MIGLVLPNAEGQRSTERDGEDDSASVELAHPDRSGGVLREGDEKSMGGGNVDADHDSWDRLCGDIAVDGVFLVQEQFP